MAVDQAATKLSAAGGHAGGALRAARGPQRGAHPASRRRPAAWAARCPCSCGPAGSREDHLGCAASGEEAPPPPTAHVRRRHPGPHGSTARAAKRGWQARPCSGATGHWPPGVHTADVHTPHRRRCALPAAPSCLPPRTLSASSSAARCADSVLSPSSAWRSVATAAAGSMLSTDSMGACGFREN